MPFSVELSGLNVPGASVLIYGIQLSLCDLGVSDSLPNRPKYQDKCRLDLSGMIVEWRNEGLNSSPGRPRLQKEIVELTSNTAPVCWSQVSLLTCCSVFSPLGRLRTFLCSRTTNCLTRILIMTAYPDQEIRQGSKYINFLES